MLPSLTPGHPRGCSGGAWKPLRSGWINHYLFLVYFPLFKVAASSLYSHLDPWPTGCKKDNNRLYFGTDISHRGGNARAVLLIQTLEMCISHGLMLMQMTNKDRLLVQLCAESKSRHNGKWRYRQVIAVSELLAAPTCVLCHLLVLQMGSCRTNGTARCVCLGG